MLTSYVTPESELYASSSVRNSRPKLRKQDQIVGHRFDDNRVRLAMPGILTTLAQDRYDIG
jgi:hypothetical protein